MNSNKRTWGPDGDVFRPERWLTPHSPPVEPSGSTKPMQPVSDLLEISTAETPSPSVNIVSSTTDKLISPLTGQPIALQNGYAHLATFSEGPRMCLGYKLALFEVKACIVAMLREVEFEEVGIVRTQSKVGSADEEWGVKITKKFSGLLYPTVTDGEEFGMGGVCLPVRVRALRSKGEEER